MISKICIYWKFQIILKGTFRNYPFTTRGQRFTSECVDVVWCVLLFHFWYFLFLPGCHWKLFMCLVKLKLHQLSVPSCGAGWYYAITDTNWNRTFTSKVKVVAYFSNQHASKCATFTLKVNSLCFLYSVLNFTTASNQPRFCLHHCIPLWDQTFTPPRVTTSLTSTSPPPPTLPDQLPKPLLFYWITNFIPSLLSHPSI